MARPKEFKDRKSISGLLEKEEFDALEEIRWRERKGQAEIIRLAIQEYIKNHAEGNSTFSLDKWQVDPQFKAIPTLLAPLDNWILYLKDCESKDLTAITIACNKIKSQTLVIRGQKGDRV